MAPERDSRIAIDPARATDVDDIPRFSVLDSEIRRRGSDELERGGVVQCDDGIPLLVRHLCGSLPQSALAVPQGQLLISKPGKRKSCSCLTCGGGGIVGGVRNLMDDAVPCETGVVDNDMDLPLPKHRRLLHQLVDVVRIQHIARDCDCFAAALVDFLRYGLRLGYTKYPQRSASIIPNQKVPS